jgi:pimeloyl-ACP methyl ester carboxylesterase
LAFQLPWLPEALARRGDWHAVESAMRATSRDGTFTADDFAEYRRAWSQPGAYTAMLHWYRAAFRYGTRHPQHRRIEPRTLILWGTRDQFLVREGAERSLAYCDRGQAIYYDEATHWLHHEEADDVNRRIIGFCRDR